MQIMQKWKFLKLELLKLVFSPFGFNLYTSAGWHFRLPCVYFISDKLQITFVVCKVNGRDKRKKKA